MRRPSHGGQVCLPPLHSSRTTAGRLEVRLHRGGRVQLTRWQRESAASATRSRPRLFTEHRDAAHSKQCAALGPGKECAAGNECAACARPRGLWRRWWIQRTLLFHLSVFDNAGPGDVFCTLACGAQDASLFGWWCLLLPKQALPARRLTVWCCCSAALAQLAQVQPQMRAAALQRRLASFRLRVPARLSVKKLPQWASCSRPESLRCQLECA